jgi:ribosomal protein S18 acetylase RimI-like enzyme
MRISLFMGSLLSDRITARIRTPMTGVKTDQLASAPDLRPAAAVDAADIAALVLVSAEKFLPAVFGPRIGEVVRRLAEGRGTLFSHAHCTIAAAGGRTIAMLLGYTGREKAAEDPATGWGLLRGLGLGIVGRLGRLLRLQATIGTLGRDEFYVSNVAAYPVFQGRGAGRLLLERAEKRAREAGAAAIVLDVETDNNSAIRLYQRLGYVTRNRTAPLSAEGHQFSFLRMGKPLP